MKKTDFYLYLFSGHLSIHTDPVTAQTIQENQMYIYNNPNINIPALNPIDLYSRPQNYIQNYTANRENPQNLVVQRFENQYQEEFKKFKQNDGSNGQQNGAPDGGKIENKEEPKENLKPNENKIFYNDFNQAYNEKNEDSDSKLTITEDTSLIKGEYICYKCNEVFPSKRNLKQHAKTCSENAETENCEKLGKYTCTQCAYRCQSPAILKIHERTHSGEKPFACTFCDYKSGQKNNVAKHILVHMKEKPFRCQYCEYRCAQKNNLVVHERTHTGYKPFACPYCEYRTVQKPNLVKHMYLHTDQKPFSCDMCSYRCVQKTNLTKHKQRHLNEKEGEKIDIKTQFKPYRPRQKSVKCPHCSYRCVQKTSLEKHLQFKHADLPQNLPENSPDENSQDIEDKSDVCDGAIQNLSVKKDIIQSEDAYSHSNK